MEKTIGLIKEHFESSSNRTPQYLTAHRTFKREFTKLLKELEVLELDISKPNHFDMSGFFRTKANKVFWFRIEDLRWSKDNMLIRTAKDFKDYTGGTNQFIDLETEQSFKEQLIKVIT